ncbi:MAG TPA: hypothetical protein VGM44_18525 [Polyangiaceae bacterium]
MKRSIRALACALIFGCVSMFGVVSAFDRDFVRAAHADEAKPNASDCMSFQNDVQDKSIVVHASNVCERKLSCTLSYAVRCEDNQGKRTSSNAGSAHFALKAQRSTELTLSAEQCKQGWSIDDVAWQCQ